MALAKAGTGLPEDVSQAKIDEFFAQFDENNDGKIQRQEWIDFFGRLFDAVIAQGLDGAQWLNKLLFLQTPWRKWMIKKQSLIKNKNGKVDSLYRKFFPSKEKPAAEYKSAFSYDSWWDGLKKTTCWKQARL